MRIENKLHRPVLHNNLTNVYSCKESCILKLTNYLESGNKDNHHRKEGLKIEY